MAVNKQHKEFYQVDMLTGWESPAGYPPGIQQKILSGTLDTKNRQGGHTRLLRFLPGAYSTEPFMHDYWEEVFVLYGDLIVGSDANGKGGTPFQQNTYCVRPPGVAHGPFRSENGCLLLESHYYDPA
jgi:hypothetical protein